MPSSNGEDETASWDNSLPKRLFATDRYPSATLNIYSKIDMLSLVHDELKGSEEFGIILRSCFGKLFEIPISRMPNSCKLVHALMCRQVLTNKKYEMRVVFGGQPFRFSLGEFASITGLPAHELPEGYDPFHETEVDKGEGSYWRQLIGDDENATVVDIAGMLKADPNIPGWRKLRLAILLIVDGVLIAKHQTGKPTPRYVQMLEDVDSFMAFPWEGNHSFTHFQASNRARAPKSYGNTRKRS